MGDDTGGERRRGAARFSEIVRRWQGPPLTVSADTLYTESISQRSEIVLAHRMERLFVLGIAGNGVGEPEHNAAEA